MKKITRTITSALLALTMTLGAAAIPAAAAERNTEQPNEFADVSEYAVSKDNLSDAETHEENKITAPDGYVLSGNLGKEVLHADKTESESVGAGVTYSVSGETLTISGSGSMKELMKDDSSYPWSNNASSIKNIIIKNGVTDIYKNAFIGFKKLETVSIPLSVTSIGENAFRCCLKLKEVVLSNNVNSLGAYSFAYCYNLKEITIPDSVTSAGNNTFDSCMNLKSVSFGKGLKSTSKSMFRSCDYLSSVDFGELETIGAESFSYCFNLESVNLPPTVKTIEEYCFGYCGMLKTVSAPSVKNIPPYAFFENKSLEYIDLPSVETIKEYAFLRCYSLKTVNLPKSTKEVELDAFERGVKLFCANPELKPFGASGLRKLDQISISGTEYYSKAFSVLSIVNKYRKQRGYRPLVMNESLLQTAMHRAAECSFLFDHYRPDSTYCTGANELMVAENIAVGQETADEVMDSWMESIWHCSNIMDETYTTIGIGCFENNGIIQWVQCFGNGNDKSSCQQPSDKQASHIVYLMPNFYKSSDFSVKLDCSEKAEIEAGQSSTCRLYIGNIGLCYFFTVLDSNGLTFSSSNNNVAVIDGKGKVTAKSPGKTTIKIQFAEYSASIQLTVVQKKPVIQKIDYSENGITVSWSKSVDSDAFILYYRSEAESKWKSKYCDNTSYTLKGLTKGVRYYFQVAGYNHNDYKQKFSHVRSGVYLLQPSLSFQNANAGLTATWNLTGSDSYIVYYRPTEQKAWSSFTTVNTKAVIPNTESGKLYCVQVQNVIDGKPGSYSKVKSMTCLDRAAIASVSYNGNNSLRWDAVGGANGYQIARKKADDTNYTYYATDNTSFSEQNVTAGTVYTYQVRAMYITLSNGTAYSAWSPSKSVVTIEKPELCLSNKKNGIRLEWSAAKGAVKYKVYYRKADSQSWSSVTTANTYYPYLNVAEGQQYCFQIRAIGKRVNGPYSKVQSKVFYNPLKVKPEVSLTIAQNSIESSWNAVEGATKYIVYYRKNDVAQWSSTQVSDCSFIYPGTEKGTTYCVKVQPLFGNTKGSYSKVQRITF